MPMGLFDRIKAGLQKTRAVFSGHMDELVENYKKLDDDFFEDLSDVLIMADVGMKTTELACQPPAREVQGGEDRLRGAGARSPQGDTRRHDAH